MPLIRIWNHLGDYVPWLHISIFKIFIMRYGITTGGIVPSMAYVLNYTTASRKKSSTCMLTCTIVINLGNYNLTRRKRSKCSYVLCVSKRNLFHGYVQNFLRAALIHEQIFHKLHKSSQEFYSRERVEVSFYTKQENKLLFALFTTLNTTPHRTRWPPNVLLLFYTTEWPQNICSSNSSSSRTYNLHCTLTRRPNILSTLMFLCAITLNHIGVFLWN